MPKQIPKSTRIIIIVHLSVIFSIGLWYFSTPFMQDLYLIRKQMMQAEFVMGKQDGILMQYADNQQKKQLLQNASYFTTLTQEKQALISNFLNELHQKTNVTFTEKIAQVFSKTLNDSPFFLSWLILSVIISIYILKQKDGARPLLFLMPLLACLYSGDLYLNYPQNDNLKERALIPSEDWLVTNYLHKTLTGSLNEQKKKLEQAWKAYLIKEWAPPDTPENEKEVAGQFQFQLARLSTYLEDKQIPNSLYYSPLMLIFFVFWNSIVAMYAFTTCTS